jgi:hypothetical protein
MRSLNFQVSRYVSFITSNFQVFVHSCQLRVLWECDLWGMWLICEVLASMIEWSVMIKRECMCDHEWLRGNVSVEWEIVSIEWGTMSMNVYICVVTMSVYVYIVTMNMSVCVCIVNVYIYVVSTSVCIYVWTWMFAFVFVFKHECLCLHLRCEHECLFLHYEHAQFGKFVNDYKRAWMIWEIYEWLQRSANNLTMRNYEHRMNMSDYERLWTSNEHKWLWVIVNICEWLWIIVNECECLWTWVTMNDYDHWVNMNDYENIEWSLWMVCEHE